MQEHPNNLLKFYARREILDDKMNKSIILIIISTNNSQQIGYYKEIGNYLIFLFKNF